MSSVDKFFTLNWTFYDQNKFHTHEGSMKKTFSYLEACVMIVIFWHVDTEVIY